MKYQKFIKENTLRAEVSYRGGGIEIDCQELFPYLEDARMTAYQNYLGGRMLGGVQSDNNFEDEVKSKDEVKFSELESGLKKYFHSLTNPLHDEEWEQTSYEENQARPNSAY